MKTPLLLTLLLFSAAPPASAATRTWDGGGAADNFNAAANWNPDGVPANGDDLVFPAAAPATVNNDLTSRTFGSITIQRGGFTLTGNAFTLTGGLTTSPGGTGGAVVIEPNITLGGSQTFTSGGGVLSSLTLGGNVTFGAHDLTLEGLRAVTFQGLTGSSNAASQLLRTGAGALRFDTSSLFVSSQPFTWTSSILDVDGVFQAPLIMTGGTLAGAGTLGLSLDASGGNIIPDEDDLQVSGNTVLRGTTNLRVRLIGPSDEHALECTGGNVTIQDQATLEVLSPSYVPVRGDSFQVLGKSTATAITGTFSNTPVNHELTLGGSVVRASYTGGNGNDLTLSTVSTTRTWDGGKMINDNWDEPENWTQNIAPQAGDVLVFPPGIDASDRGLDNNFPNGTNFRQIVFNGDDFTVRGNFFRLTHGITLAAGVRANMDTDVGLLQDQTFALGSSSQLHFDLLDEILTAGRTLTLSGGDPDDVSGSTILDGTISGDGGLRIAAGSGIALAANSTYNGPTSVETGSTLVVLNRESALGSSAGETTVAGKLIFSPNVGQFSRLVINESLALLPGCTVGTRGSTVFDSDVELQRAVTLLGPGTMRLAAVDTTLRVNAAISGTGDLVTVNEVVFEGTAPNTFSGSVRVEAFRSLLQKSNPGDLAVPCQSLIIDPADTNVAGTLFPRTLETQQDEQIADNCHVTVKVNSFLNIGNVTARTETIGTLTLEGGTATGPGNSQLILTRLEGAGTSGSSLDVPTRFTVEDSVVHVPESGGLLKVQANLSGTNSGQLRKTGSGTLEFDSGTVSLPIQIDEGAILLRIAVPQLVSLNGGRLTGSAAAAGGITSMDGGGILAPLGAAGQTGVLPSGSIFFNPATTFEVQVSTAVTGAGYDQLSATGSVVLGGATLGLQLLSGFNIAVGQNTFPLLNDGTDAIIGTFAGLPLGAFIPIPAANGGGGWIISYTGGTGNDVALTRVANPPPAEVIPTVTGFTFGNPDQNGNRPVTIAGKGTPGASYQLETSVDLFPLPTWTIEGSVQTANATTGALSFTTTASPPERRRQFWRFRKL